VPLINSYIEGPALRDERRNRAVMHKAVATQEWINYFGGKTETRWDNFEDFLYLMCETYLSTHLDLIRHVHWDKFFAYFYKKHAKNCLTNEFIKEIPEIPFIKDRPVFRGKIMKMDDWTQIMMR
jgi:hypothetical protein